MRERGHHGGGESPAHRRVSRDEQIYLVGQVVRTQAQVVHTSDAW